MTTTVSSKDPTEIVPVLFDFTLQLASGETITTAICNVTVNTGTDATPNSIKSGVALINGTKVTQWVQAGIAGVNYHILCTITTSLSPETIVLAAILPIINA